MAKVVMNDEWSICDVWDVHAIVIGITTCMSMSMTTGRSHRSCLKFIVWPACHWTTPCNYFTLLLTGSHSSRSNSRRGNFMKTRWWRSWWWRSWCQAGDKMIMEPQDGDQRSYVILAISCHVYYLIACDVYHVYASYLLRTTVVNKMIPH